MTQIHSYLIDFKLLGSVRVRAESEEAAKAAVREALDCADINAGVWPHGSANAGEPILFEASQDGELDVVEIDGEAA